MTAVSIRLPDEVSERLKNLAKFTGRSKTFYMIEAIKEKLDDIEDIYFAEKEIEAIRKGYSKTTLLSEVMKRYEMDY